MTSSTIPSSATMSSEDAVADESTAAAAGEHRARSRFPTVAGGGASTYLGLLALVVVLLVMFATSESLFRSGDNLQNLARQGSALAILAAGQAFVILIGGIDISVGAQVSLVSIVTVTLSHSLPLPVALLVGVLTGCGVGLVNGLLVTVARISPIITTVATWQLLGGLVLLWTNGQPRLNFSSDYRWLGGSQIGFLATPTLIAVIVAVLGWFTLTRTRFGRYVYAIGGNREAARLSGVATPRIVVLCYVVCGMCAAIAGLLLSSRVAGGSAAIGAGLEITTIAAVFIGGVAWGGGSGSMIGVVLGVALLAILSNGLDLAGTNSNVQTLITGALMLVAVGLNNVRLRGSRV